MVVALVLLGVGLAWFWSLAAVKPDQARQVTLEVQRSPVTVTLPGSTDAHDATDGMTLPQGAVVKTGEGGRAVIHFYDQAESRLDAKSEATISTASAGTDEGGNVNVTLELGAGRAWSRVLRLFDLDSSFAVKTPSVVATVRGTAFDVRANSDGTSDVWVSESAVSIAPVSGSAPASELPIDGVFHAASSTPVITAGESAHYGSNGKIVWRKPIPSDEKASSWFTENRAADEIFERDEGTRLRKELDGRSDAVGQAVDGLTRASERLHLALAKGANGDRLGETYLARHIASAVTLAEAGKAGIAAQQFSRIENELKDRLSGPNADRERRNLQAALARVAPMIQDAAPGSADYPFKQRVEDLSVLAAQNDDASILYARLRAADARLDEADRLMNSGTLDEAKSALTAAHDGLGNAMRDSTSVLPNVNEARRTALTGKLVALLTRSVTEQARLESLLMPAPDMGSTTSTDAMPTVPTSTKPIVPIKPPSSGATSTKPVTTPGVSAYAGIAVFAQPNPIDPGSVTKLSVLATKVGGGTEDVSARATYRIVTGVGTLSGATFTATTPGTVTFEATFVDQGKSMISRVALTVNGTSAVLQSLSGAPSAPTMQSGGQVTLNADATYSTGFKQDVSSKTVWQNLTPNLGTLSGNVFTAAIRVYGTAQFDGTYTEDGVTKTVSISVVIQ